MLPEVALPRQGHRTLREALGPLRIAEPMEETWVELASWRYPPPFDFYGPECSRGIMRTPRTACLGRNQPHRLMPDQAYSRGAWLPVGYPATSLRIGHDPGCLRE